MPTLDAVDEISIARARTPLSANQDLLQRVELGLLQSSIRKEGLENNECNQYRRAIGPTWTQVLVVDADSQELRNGTWSKQE